MHGHGVLGDQMAITAVMTVAVFGCRTALDRLHLHGAGRAHADLDAPVLHESPVERVIVIAESGDHAQHQIASSTRRYLSRGHGVTPRGLGRRPFKQACGPGPNLRHTAMIREYGVE